MVKPKPQASPQPETPGEDFSKQHPLLREGTQIDGFLQAAQKRKEAKEFQIEELEQWKACVNGLAASPNGRLFLQNMVKYTGRNDPANIRDTMKMVDVGIKSAFYLTWVRPFLDPSLRKDIE